jgi:hypothetical protein
MNLVHAVTKLATSLATNGIVLLKEKQYIFIDQLDVAIFVNLFFFLVLWTVSLHYVKKYYWIME